MKKLLATLLVGVFVVVMAGCSGGAKDAAPAGGGTEETVAPPPAGTVETPPAAPADPAVEAPGGTAAADPRLRAQLDWLAPSGNWVNMWSISRTTAKCSSKAARSLPDAGWRRGRVQSRRRQVLGQRARPELQRHVGRLETRGRWQRGRAAISFSMDCLPKRPGCPGAGFHPGRSIRRVRPSAATALLHLGQDAAYGRVRPAGRTAPRRGRRLQTLENQCYRSASSAYPTRARSLRFAAGIAVIGRSEVPALSGGTGCVALRGPNGC